MNDAEITAEIAALDTMVAGLPGAPVGTLGNFHARLEPLCDEVKAHGSAQQKDAVLGLVRRIEREVFHLNPNRPVKPGSAADQARKP